MQDIITVVVPVYNAEKYLKRCIDSIISQTYVNLDIILVNDGSTDRSGNICDEYAKRDSRVRVIHKENEGVSRARNVGIQDASGKYLIFVDSDDYLNKFYVEKMYTTQMTYQKAYILCGFQMVTEDGKYAGKNLYDEKEEISEVSVRDVINIINKWLINMPWNKLYHVDILKSNNISMIEDISLAEDLLFNFEYIEKLTNDKVVIVNEPLYTYVIQRSGSLDSKYCSKQLEIMHLVIERLYQLCVSKKIENLEGYYGTAVSYLEGVMRNNMKKDNPKSFRNKIQDNNKLMQSKEYQYYLKESKKFFSWSRRLVCRRGYYILYILYFYCCKVYDFFRQIIIK